MTDYNSKFPPALSMEEKNALIWRIERDYERSSLEGNAPREEYITFAINFYTRSGDSLNEILFEYRNHNSNHIQKTLAEAFMADMLHKVKTRSVEHYSLE